MNPLWLIVIVFVASWVFIWLDDNWPSGPTAGAHKE